MISYSSERIGLIFSVPPSHAWALPMRPPRRRYSSVSRQNQIRSALRASRTRATTASLVGARARRGARGEHAAAEAAAGRFAVDHLDALAEAALGEQRRAPGAPPRTVPEMPPARWIETTSWPASSSGSQTARKSPIDGCEVVGSSGSRAQALVEGVEAVHLELALGLALPADVQADLVDPLLVGERARQVVRAVGGDRDGGHARAGRYTQRLARARPTRTSR